MASSLNRFRDLISEIDDSKLLEVAESILRDMTEINIMKEKIEMMEEKLTEGDRAAFWFHASALDQEERDLASNMVIGRKRILQDKEDAKNGYKRSREAGDAEMPIGPQIGPQMSATAVGANLGPSTGPTCAGPGPTVPDDLCEELDDESI